MTDKELLCTIYKCVLKFAGCETDDKNNIHIRLGDDSSNTLPLTIDGKSVVLPTNDNLTKNNDNTIIFHPLAENIYKEERPVLVRLRKIINVKLNFVIGVLVQHLLNIVASPELHKDLSPEQLELVTKIRNVDKKTLDTFVKILTQGADTSPDKNFVFIYLKKRAKIIELNDKGEKQEKIYSRGGIVTFPFYTKLEEKDKNLRVKDVEAFKNIFEYIFTDIHNTEFYNLGSSSRQAPSLEAILKTAMNLASILNDQVTLFSNFIDGYEHLLFDMDFYDYFKDEELIERVTRSVPPQDGSEGIISEITKNSTQEVVAVQTDNKFKPFSNLNIGVIEKPKVVSTGKGLDWGSVVNSNPDVARSIGAGSFSSPGFGQRQPVRPTPGQRYNNSNSGSTFGNRGFGGNMNRNYGDSSI